MNLPRTRLLTHHDAFPVWRIQGPRLRPYLTFATSRLLQIFVPTINVRSHSFIKMANATDMEKQPLLENGARPQPNQEPEHEPTLRELQQNVSRAQRAYMRAWSRTTSGKWHKRIMFAVTFLLLSFMVFCMALIGWDALTEEDDGWGYPGKVPLEAHIMSKCPDARDCLHDLILPAMQNVSHKVDFRLSYIVSLFSLPIPRYAEFFPPY